MGPGISSLHGPTHRDPPAKLHLLKLPKATKKMLLAENQALSTRPFAGETLSPQTIGHVLC